MPSSPRWSSPVTKAEMVAGDGAAAIEFMQRHCRVSKDSIGGLQGEPLRLRDWQQQQIYRLLARRADGTRKHRRGLLGVARKNTKSTIGSALAIREADQGPNGGEVYCCAGEKEQARIVYAAAKWMIEHDPELAARVKPYKNELVWPATDTRLKVLSAEAYSKEGLNPTFVVFDEVHVQPDDDLWDVMTHGMGARVEPMILGITTAGSPVDRLGNDSLAYRLYDHGKRVAAGEVVDDSFYFAWWEPGAPPDNADGSPGVIDHTDPQVWAQANPGLGDFVSEADFHSTIATTHEAEFRTKRCNLWVMGKTAAVPAGKWETRSTPRPHDGATTRFGSGIDVPTDWLADTVLFLDGSWVGDSTGLVAATRDGYLFVVTHYEKLETDGPDWNVSRNSVKADCVKAMNLGARGLLYDPFGWQQTAADLEDAGYPVAEWHTSSLPRIVPAWKDFYRAIIDDELSHDANPAMARHVGNVVIKQDARGARPVKAGTRRHIDLAICAIGAYANRDIEFGPETPVRAKIWSAI